jgi:hypothetical protein
VATRAEAILESAREVLNTGVPNNKWYMSKPVWDFVYHVVDIAIDTVRRYRENPDSDFMSNVQSAAKDTSSVKEADVTAYLRVKLQALKSTLSTVEEYTPEYYRIDGQIELINELIYGVKSGEEQESN